MCCVLFAGIGVEITLIRESPSCCLCLLHCALDLILLYQSFRLFFNRNQNIVTVSEMSSKEGASKDSRGLAFGTDVVYDDAYAGGGDNSEFVSSLPTLDEEKKMKSEVNSEEIDEGRMSNHPSTLLASKRSSVRDVTSVLHLRTVMANMHTNSLFIPTQADDDGDDVDPFTNANGGSGLVNTRISDREGEYHKRRHDRVLREDGLSFKESMKQANIEKEREELIKEAKEDLSEEASEEEAKQGGASKRRKRRWDQGAEATATTAPADRDAALVSDADSVASSRASKWDEDPSSSKSRRRKRWDETPVASSNVAATPLVSSSLTSATPMVKATSKWDETPMISSGARVAETPAAGAGNSTNRWDATPAASSGQQVGVPQTPSGEHLSGNLAKALALEREMESRNRPWTAAALDAILPSEGYTVILPPQNYTPLRTPGRKLLATPTPMGMTPQGFQMEIPVEQRQDASVQDIREAYGVPLAATAVETGDASSLPYIKPEDMQYFGRLMEESDEEKLSKEEANERRIMTLLLKIKNGTPPQRKTAMRQISDKSRSFGAGPLFNQILPLLMSPTLEDQERHLLVKVIDRVLYKLDDLVRPYVHRILAVIEPLLIDEDYYARVEGREIISNLAKAAGLATMIATMRPDIDSPEEYVRNTTARAVAVVASALGIPSLLPFLKAVCQSRKSWQARHTGIKIVQQIALLMGVAVLPYLRELVEIVSHGLVDDMQKVRIITALTCAALAEASHPYGIESFDSAIRPLWKGALDHHGKALAAFLKAVGYIIPLMEESYASHYTRLVMPILLREFHSPDEEMKRIVLKVIQQCVATAGVEPEYIRNEILPEFFKNFWIRRMALDRRNYNQVVETTEELANKVGCSDVIIRIVDDLKDDSEPYRRMVMETVKKVLEKLGAGDIDERLEERLIDGILYAFQEQAVDASVTGISNLGRESQIMLDGFGAVVVSLGERCKPYLKQIAGTIKWRLNNKAASVRMQAADLVGRIAVVMKACNEDQLMGHLGVVLYEYLGEEFPEVLGSILGALRAIVNVIGMTKMTPPIRDLLPRLTPILRNRHEKVQENCIDLVGRIADRGAEFVSAKEWMRICFELLEMLKAHKKAIRRAAVSTFGFIARAIGPQDVLHTLLNNLKVQDRQMRVCTTVAIAIVAETCGPFTVLPALMNEYRVPEINIQNGVLKALSFMFEYIGDMGKDYVYAVTPLLEDALMDRDPVHRQTGCAAVKHLALGVAGRGCEDALLHLLNFVWPNVFEESPHVIQAVFDAIQGLTVALGPNLILQYTLQGLYHPARKVREVYWRVFNTLYIYSADALVAGFPIVEDEGENTYARTSLELFI
jgi:splicing factor 3B subunit 1